MAGHLNKVCIIGNLGKDPEVRTLNSGSKVTNLSVATTESWTDKNSGEKREKTEWHRVVIFNEKLGEIADRYLRKGSKVYLEGALQTRKWEKDGVDQYSTEVVLQGFDGKLILLGDPAGGRDDRQSGGDRGRSDDRGGGGHSYQGSGGDRGSGGSRQQSRESFSADLDDEIPFASSDSIW